MKLIQSNQTSVERLAILCAAFMLALAPFAMLAAMLDDRQLNGVNVWVKPLHFQLSLALYYATLALLAPLFSPAWRQSRLARWSMFAAAVAGLGEIAYITLQAARGRHSHFNTSTPLEAALYSIMGLGAVTLVAVTFIWGLALVRQNTKAAPSGLRSGAVLGLILGSVATLLIAGYLSAGDGHWVGGLRSDAGGLPLVGWSMTGGDLRAPHFFATHAMQALPLAGLAADWASPALAQRYVLAATMVWSALIVASLAQAWLGLPLLGHF